MLKQLYSKFCNIEVSAISKHRSAVVAVLSAKSRFSAKTVSVKPSFWYIIVWFCLFQYILHLLNFTLYM